jgi:DNA-binding MarR family transcriptional regulator
VPTPTESVFDVDSRQVASLQDASLRLTRRLRKHSQTELTMSQISALSTLQRHGPLRVGELAQREQISKSSVTRLVARLEATGYLERKVDPEDGRSFVVAITAHGHDLLASARQRANGFLALQVNRLAEDDRRALLAALPALERLAGLS